MLYVVTKFLNLILSSTVIALQVATKSFRKASVRLEISQLYYFSPQTKTKKKDPGNRLMRWPQIPSQIKTGLASRRAGHFRF